MGIGFLKINATTGDGAIPIAYAKITIKNNKGKILYHTKTDRSRNTNKETSILPIAIKPYIKLSHIDKSLFDTFSLFSLPLQQSYF